MSTMLIVIHLIITLFLVLVILLQNGSGDTLGSMAGGGGGGMFSPRSGKTFLSRLTAILATAFICSSLVLAYVAKNKTGGPSAVDSLLGDLPTVETQSINPTNDLLPIKPIKEIEVGPEPELLEFDKPDVSEQVMPDADEVNGVTTEESVLPQPVPAQ